MLLIVLVLHPQFAVGRGALHIVGVVAAGGVVRVLRIVQRIGDAGHDLLNTETFMSCLISLFTHCE